jgi:hypothetical protein
MKVQKSKIDDSWMVFIIEPSDENYNDVHKELFEKFGIAYAALENKIIFINGKEIQEQRLTQNHLLAIEAHEIGHFISDHKGLINKSLVEMEKEADWAAYQILLEIEKNKAASLIADRFKGMYEQDIKEYEIRPSTRFKIEKFINETKVV